MADINSRDEKGRLLPGHGGLKKKGDKNRLQSEIKEKITEFLHCKIASLDEIFDEVSSKDKLRFLVEITSYVLPKSREMEEEITISNEQQRLDQWPEEDLKALLALHLKNKNHVSS